MHEKAGRFAIAFVLCATTFSLCTQAYLIGSGAATIAAQLGITPGVLLMTLLPHAIPELVALFLPLAAWIVASRRDDWQDLLAATAVTVAIAVPVLLAAAAVEIWVSPLPAERGVDGVTRRSWPGTRKQTGRPEGRPVWTLLSQGVRPTSTSLPWWRSSCRPARR